MCIHVCTHMLKNTPVECERRISDDEWVYMIIYIFKKRVVYMIIYIFRRVVYMIIYIFIHTHPPDHMHHAKILKGQPRRCAVWELVLNLYKSFPPDHFGGNERLNHVE